MCGFIALFSSHDSWDKNILQKGVSSMASRGPDGSGEWWSKNQRVGLAHRRLAIIDLDDRSDQPMISTSGRYVIVFNGEIYNYKNLRKELLEKNIDLKTYSDTEVILELFSLYGENSLKKLQGMFAFAIWDKISNKLFMARDPYGIKPLYFSKTDRGYIVASQVRAILSTGIVSRDPCPYGQGGYWLLGSVPEPYTWFRNIEALPSGNYMWIDKNSAKKKIWHSIADSWSKEKTMPDRVKLEKHVQKALHHSVEKHLVSDVPVGIFLSGGIDSTSLLAMMHDLGSRNITGITLKFSEFENSNNDESIIAANIAKKYGVRHHIRMISKSEFIDDLPKILLSMDQPSIDGINTWYASKCASELGLKVVISGVGGDELFQGYRSFVSLPILVKYWNIASKIPGIERIVGFLMKGRALKTNNPRWRLFTELAKSIPGAWFLNRSVFTPAELKGLMGEDLANEFLTDFNPVDMVKKMSGKLPNNMKLALSQIESTCYLRNQLLRDSDWASMCHGVELRTPLVDSHLLQNLEYDIPNFSFYPNKMLLSNAPKISLNSFITRKKKTGFGIPVNQWLKEAYPEFNDFGESKAWARKVANDAFLDTN